VKPERRKQLRPTPPTDALCRCRTDTSADSDSTTAVGGGAAGAPICATVLLDNVAVYIIFNNAGRQRQCVVSAL